MKKVVLVAEDDEIIYESIELSLAKEGIQTIHMENGSKALSFFLVQPVPVVLTDLRMPEMNGHELVDQFLKLENPPLILIQSVVDDIQTIINLMRRGVYDYLIKPYSLQELVLRVKKAFELSELRALKQKSERRFSLDFPYLSENTAINSMEKLDRLLNSIVSIHSTEEGVVLTKDCFLSLKEKYKATSSVFHELERLCLHNHIPEQGDTISLCEFQLFIENILVDLMELSLFKKQKLEINACGNLLADKYVALHKANFQCIIKELIINAMKFGLSESTISVHLELGQESLILTIENEIPNDIHFPVSLDMIFEPFFQSDNSQEGIFPSSNIGLGLTLVRKVVLNHSGTIKCSRKTFENREYILFTISLPLQKKSVQ